MGIESFFNQTIKIENAPTDSDGDVKRDSRGWIDYDAEVSVSARVENETEVVTTEDGKELISSGRCYIPASTSVKTEDRLTLPDGRQPPILVVDPVVDGAGNTHHKVIFYG